MFWNLQEAAKMGQPAADAIVSHIVKRVTSNIAFWYLGYTATHDAVELPEDILKAFITGYQQQVEQLKCGLE